MAYIEFPDDLKGQKDRKAFYLSEEGLILIRGWRRNGVPLTEIAEKYIGITKSTWWGWYKAHEDLRKACATSRDITNMSVEEALLKKALGYDWWDETYELVEGDLILVRKHKNHVSPDVKACLSWLYNYAPNRWRAIQEPLEQTQYVETVKNILVAMKEVAETGAEKSVEIEGVQDGREEDEDGEKGREEGSFHMESRRHESVQDTRRG